MRVREYVAESVHARDHRGLFRAGLGIALLIVGIVIAVFPQILVILISSLIASAGLGLLISGIRARSKPRRVPDAREFFFRP